MVLILFSVSAIFQDVSKLIMFFTCVHERLLSLHYVSAIFSFFMKYASVASGSAPVNAIFLQPLYQCTASQGYCCLQESK